MFTLSITTQYIVSLLFRANRITTPHVLQLLSAVSIVSVGWIPNFSDHEILRPSSFHSSFFGAVVASPSAEFSVHSVAGSTSTTSYIAACLCIWLPQHVCSILAVVLCLLPVPLVRKLGKANFVPRFVQP